MEKNNDLLVSEALKRQIPIKGRLGIVTKTLKTVYCPGFSYEDWKNSGTGTLGWKNRKGLYVHIGSVVMVMNHFRDFRWSAMGGDTEILHDGKLVFVPCEFIKLVKIEDTFNSKTFCITGQLSRPREYFKTFIQMKGGKFKSTLSKRVDYLILGQYTNITGKSIKQQKS